MNTLTALQEDVENELRWDPEIHSERIGVTVIDGVVQLDGHVDSLLEKWAAERAVLRLRDVRALANEIEVDVLPGDQKSDASIAEAILQQFQWNHGIPGEVKVKVADGWVTLEGAVEAEFQKRNAEAAVGWIKGVRGITSRIKVDPKINVTVVKETILEAIRRNAALDADTIFVENEGAHLTLSGRVRSWLEKAEANRIAWKTPGVVSVIDRLTFG